MEQDIRRQIKYIADAYGYESQSRQCIEEMAELTQAINKLWRKQQWGTGMEMLEARFDVLEEIADVKIMIEQMEYLLDGIGDIEPKMRRKLYRQIKRIERELAE